MKLGILPVKGFCQILHVPTDRIAHLKNRSPNIPTITVTYTTMASPFFSNEAHAWKGKDVLSTSQFNEESLDFLFDMAERLREEVKSGKPIKLLEGKVLACAFMEPSTRTSCSFLAAIQRLGGTSIMLNEQVRTFENIGT